MGCVSFLQGFAMRATALDTCGAPVGGASGMVVTTGFIKVEVEPDEADGEEIEQTKADGTRCYYRKTAKKLNGHKVNAEFCNVDYELFQLITGVTVLLDDAVSPEARGFAIDSATYASTHFALELWTDTDSGCLDTSGRRYGYILLPWVYNGSVGTPTIENGSANFTLTDAFTRFGNQWGVGPYDMQYSSAGVASPLFSPISATTDFLLWQTNMAPPTEVCGYQNLVLPT